MELDLDGDASPDFIVEYGWVDDALYGELYRPGDESPVLCPIEAEYREAVHRVYRAINCLGVLTSFGYRVDFYYDTDSARDEASGAIDSAPDKGLARNYRALRIRPTSSRDSQGFLYLRPGKGFAIIGPADCLFGDKRGAFSQVLDERSRPYGQPEAAASTEQQ